MPPDLSTTHAELGEFLAGLRCGVGPSDLHGSLTGYLCAGGRADPRRWLATITLDPDLGDAPHALLETLYRECAAWLDDPELGFEPLLPAAEVGVDARADALVEWCRGFLGGLGLAGSAANSGLSADAAEILQDFGTIAASRFEYSDAEEDETALAEVVEFIRVGVLLLHTELAVGGLGNATVH